MVKVKLLRYTADGVRLIAGSARVSGLPKGLEDGRVVRMMVENDYGSILEHVYFTFDISEVSIALSRELLEHRVASHTARSTRYHVEEGFGYVIPSLLEGDMELLEDYRKTMEDNRGRYIQFYRRMLERGFSEEEAREVSRYLLPLAAHTRYVWTVNARSLINFLGLRLCVRASPEMRELASKIKEVVEKVYPEIFAGVGCRGVNFGLCPENENRPASCPYLGKIPSKKEAGRGFKTAREG